MGHFIPNFELKLLNKWICFIICTSYLTEKIVVTFRTSPKSPLRSLETKSPLRSLEASVFFSSLCPQCFGSSQWCPKYRMRNLNLGWQIMNGPQEICEPPGNLQKFKCIRLKNKKFQLFAIYEDANSTWLNLMRFGEGGLEIKRGRNSWPKKC